MDGRPILWKLRDTEQLKNHIAYFSDGKYEYIGMVNSDSTARTMVWGGCNSAGFAIMNSASFNTNLDKPTAFTDQEGVVMKRALMECATLEDFEHFLDRLPRPMGLNANFGVIDAQGGAAYYETDNTHYVKFDANDPRVAPHGYLIRSNYSFTGKPNVGYGFIRYARAEELIRRRAATGKLDVPLFVTELSRDMRNPMSGVDYNAYISPKAQGDMVNTADMICRHGSASNIVLVGARAQSKVRDYPMMWGTVAFPLTTVAVPAWPRKDGIPRIASRDEKAEQCQLARWGLTLMERCYPIQRGSGSRYMDIAVLRNSVDGGMANRILEVEASLLARYTQLRWGERERGAQDKLLALAQESIEELYDKLLARRPNARLAGFPIGKECGEKRR